uniref:Protein MULTIPOLAR SPINDLE 1 n=1 Tax=Chenopodium quinoa TaxID=63459 RepID=A0A803MFC9_CHEQI
MAATTPLMAEPTAAAMNSNESMKIAIAMALLRSKLLSQPHSSLSSSASRTFHWKQKAKNRKQEIQRLSDELKRLEEYYKEKEVEKLKISAEFLVDLCETTSMVKRPNFANLAHQAVEFILGSVSQVLATGKDMAVTDGIISNLIVCLIKRTCTPLENELCDPETDSQIHIQHIIRMLGNVSYVGQRVLLSVCHRISEPAERLLSLDPFDESFPQIHDSMFVMIQLIEFLVSDYLVTWSKDEGLFEEWLISFLHARKTLQSMEKRSGLYSLYLDRVTGELARQVGQVLSLQKLNQDILDELFS